MRRLAPAREPTVTSPGRTSASKATMPTTSNRLVRAVSHSHAQTPSLACGELAERDLGRASLTRSRRRGLRSRDRAGPAAHRSPRPRAATDTMSSRYIKVALAEQYAAQLDAVGSVAASCAVCCCVAIHLESRDATVSALCDHHAFVWSQHLSNRAIPWAKPQCRHPGLDSVVRKLMIDQVTAEICGCLYG
jgi:hypothetical protein